MKGYTPKQKIKNCREEIVKCIGHWKDIKDNGCHDPFWADGVNMNLARNHILYNKSMLFEICTQENIPIPDEYYLQTPPEVNSNYMANLQQRERVKRLRQHGMVLTTRAACYDSAQLSVFN